MISEVSAAEIVQAMIAAGLIGSMGLLWRLTLSVGKFSDDMQRWTNIVEKAIAAIDRHEQRITRVETQVAMHLHEARDDFRADPARAGD